MPASRRAHQGRTPRGLDVALRDRAGQHPPTLKVAARCAKGPERTTCSGFPGTRRASENTCTRPSPPQRHLGRLLCGNSSPGPWYLTCVHFPHGVAGSLYLFTYVFLAPSQKVGPPRQGTGRLCPLHLFSTQTNGWSSLKSLGNN